MTPRYDPTNASRYLWERHHIKRSRQTLAKLRCIGGGPEFRRAGKNVVYDQGCLDAWAESKISPLRRSTSDSAEG
jgi:hypothetical protein